MDAIHTLGKSRSPVSHASPKSISERSPSLPLIPVFNEKQLERCRNSVGHPFPTVYIGIKIDSSSKIAHSTLSTDLSINPPPSKRPCISTPENATIGKQIINAAGDAFHFPLQQSMNSMEMKKSKLGYPNWNENISSPSPAPIPNQLTFFPNKHLSRQDFQGIQSDNMPNMPIGSLGTGRNFHSSKNMPEKDFRSINSNHVPIAPLGPGNPFHHANNNMSRKDFRGIKSNNAPIAPLGSGNPPFHSSKSKLVNDFRGINDDNVPSLVVGTLGTISLFKNEMKNQGFNPCIPSKVHTIGKQVTLKDRDIQPNQIKQPNRVGTPLGNRGPQKQSNKEKFNLSELASKKSAHNAITKLQEEMNASLNSLPASVSQQESTKPSQGKLQPDDKALLLSLKVSKCSSSERKKTVKSTKAAESSKDCYRVVDTSKSQQPKKQKTETTNLVNSQPKKPVTPNTSTVKYKEHKHRRISAANGVEVEFVDGVRMIVKRKADITFIDDGPIRTWDLKPGTNVAVKYSDGYVYDAVVVGSVGSKSNDKPSISSVKVENSTYSPEDECWEPKHLKLPGTFQHFIDFKKKL